MSNDSIAVIGGFGIAFIVMGAIWLGMAYHLEVGPFYDRSGRISAQEDLWRGAVIVKICGRTHIWKLRDGTFVTGGWGSSRVAGPDVC